MEKSKKVARLFQDKIPHEEIIERQNAQKYLKAAKLANQGLSIEEIAGQIDIPRGELELIVKLNRQNLVSPQGNPWLEDDDVIVDQPVTEIESTKTFSMETPPEVIPPVVAEPPPQQIEVVQTSMASAVGRTVVFSTQNLSGSRIQDSPSVRPVIFKKIITDRN